MSRKQPEQASVAMRVLQEALANSMRHASASRVEVRLRFHRLLDGQPSELNVGLYGMIERSEQGTTEYSHLAGPEDRNQGDTLEA